MKDHEKKAPSRRWRWHHIPPCGGLHGLADEQYCYDCRKIAYQAEQLRLARRHNELLEIQLDEVPRERRPRPYYPQPPAEPKPKPPTIERRSV